MRILITALLLAASPVLAQVPGQVVADGVVPDEPTKAAILQKLRELYGAERLVDKIEIGNVSVPPNWPGYMQKLLAPHLKLVGRGQLKVEGNVVTIRGEVANEAQRQQVVSDIATSLNPTYTVNNGLRVSAAEQEVLDAALARRIIEFESGQAVIRPSGLQILDEMAVALQKVKGKRVEVIGHTDNTGQRGPNIALSLARADAVRRYLAGKGCDPEQIGVQGHGPDRPVADNGSPDGRARNRRIEFRVVD